MDRGGRYMSNQLVEEAPGEVCWHMTVRPSISFWFPCTSDQQAVAFVHSP